MLRFIGTLLVVLCEIVLWATDMTGVLINPLASVREVALFMRNAGLVLMMLGLAAAVMSEG